MVNRKINGFWGIRFLKIILFIICVCTFVFFCGYGFGYEPLSNQYLMSALVVLFAFFFLYLTRIYKAYVVGATRIVDMVYSQFLSSLISLVICYFFFCFFSKKWMNPIPFLFTLCAHFLVFIIWSFFTTKLFFKLNKPKDTILVYSEKSDLYRILEAESNPSKYHIVNKVCVKDSSIDEVMDLVKNIPVVFAAGLNNTLQNALVKYCVEHNVQGYFAPHVGDIILAGAEHVQSFSTPILQITRSNPAPEYLFIKRLFDIILSLVGIVVFSPFMLITAIMIKCYDRGPVLYKQNRLTKDGKVFKILKFRSMCVDAEKDGVARLSSEHDNRITPVGRIIRAFRFDELPQLFNILSGDMTIVGPRPERPEIAKQYLSKIPSFDLRLQVTAGLTGYAQVYGKYNTNPYDKLEMDLMYINKMSFITDLELIFATVRILFLKESTSGIKDSQTTALEGEDA